MLSVTFFACLSLGLLGAGCSLSCDWMERKFKRYSKTSLDLLDAMANNSTNATEDAAVEDTVAFPNNQYSQASNASAEDKLAFTVQILRRTADVFEEDYSSASWEESAVDDFLNILTQQAEGLHSCIGSQDHKKNKRLDMYFKRLLSHVLKEMGHSAEAWELIRKEIKAHLMRTDQLVSSLLTTN